MSDTLKEIADNLGVTTINGSYLSGIAQYYGVNLATSKDLMKDILTAVGGNPATSTDYLQDIVLELGGTVTINGNWMEAWEAITSGPAAAPVNTVLPNVTGTAVVGNALTTTNGTWTNSPTSYAYQWKRGATNIGTNANAYTLVNADAGQSITCVVTATNAIGSTPATSNALTIQNFFTTEWTTTASSESIELPYLDVVGTYSGTIDWGDSSTDSNSYANRTHVYATAGTYTVVISGNVIGWDFSGIFGSTYITSVVHWGQLQFGFNGAGYFGDCPNLDLSSVSDVLNLTGITDLYYMFGGCTSLTSINRIGEWNTSAITNMNAMFQLCDQINFNIGTWDVGNVADFTDFMDSATTTFSTTNLNAIYNGWSASGVQNDCSITFGTAEYTTAGGQAGKDILISVVYYNWTIIDGGGI
jgi:surface protein